MQSPSQKPRTNLLKRILILTTLGAGLAVSFPFLAFGALLAQDGWGEWQRCRGYTQFNAEAWQEATLISAPRHVRSCMVDDLLAQGLLTGQKQADVKVLLGEPESEIGYFPEYDLVYHLGPERSFISIDSEWLVLKLDSSGQVSEAKLVTD
ncbi:MAG: hypothetical protein ICV77_10790 [Cyanobacteria bacterium Co-bin8]|nr:hypothetical protein [Cyanobacteria bacterium Co-bin8]